MNFQESSKKRLSILKTPKAQNNEAKGKVLTPSSRSAVNRVSFSSNYIKRFTTDEEKNTIWDTTIEEPISNTESTQSTESTHSTNYQNLDMSMTLNVFNDDGSDMEITNLASQDDLMEEKKSISLFREEVHEVYVDGKIENCQAPPSEKENIPPFRQQLSNSNKKIEKINISMHTLTQSCSITQTSKNKCEQSVGEDMEMSCVNQNGNTSELMEFTCNNPILPSYPAEKELIPTEKVVLTPNSSQDMEFTCLNPVFPLDSAEKIQKNITLTSNPPEDMEFTCRNPLPTSNFQDYMEFTCKNLPSVSDRFENEAILGTKAIPNSPVDMEFTCRNLLPTSNSQDDMEFTCKNLPIMSGVVEVRAALRNNSMPHTPVDMEFTCRNRLPISSTNSQEDMELTCKNLPPIFDLVADKSIVKSESIPSTPINMESMPTNTSQIIDLQKDMEFTCQNPILVPDEYPEIIQNKKCISTIPVIEKNYIRLEPVGTVVNDKNKSISSNVGYTPSSLHIHRQEEEDLETTHGGLPSLKLNSTNILEELKENIVSTSIINDNKSHNLKHSLVTSQVIIDQSINDDSNTTAYLLRCSTLNKTYEVNNTTRSLLHELSIPQGGLPNSITDSISNVQEVEMPSLSTLNETKDEQEPQQVSTSKLMDESCYPISRNLADTIIDDEISPELIISFNDPPSVNSTNDNMKEDQISERSSRKSFQTHDSLDHAKYQAEKQKEKEEEMRALEELARYKQEFKDMFRSMDELLVRGRNSRKEYSEKFAKFSEYRNKLLREAITDRDCPKSLENTQSSNRDSSSNFEDIEDILPSLAKRIKDKSELPECKWKIVKLEDGVGCFTTLLGKFEIRLEYEPTEIVSKVDTKSLLTRTSRPVAFLMEKEFVRAITGDKITNSIGNRYTIMTFLDYIQLVMQNIIEYYLDLKELQMSYQLELTYDYRASFIILDADLIFKCICKIDLSDLDNITRASVIIENPIGHIDKEKLFSFIPECSKGVQFIRTFVNKIEQYKESLKRRFIHSKKL